MDVSNRLHTLFSCQINRWFRKFQNFIYDNVFVSICWPANNSGGKEETSAGRPYKHIVEILYIFISNYTRFMMFPNAGN